MEQFVWKIKVCVVKYASIRPAITALEAFYILDLERYNLYIN